MKKRKAIILVVIILLQFFILSVDSAHVSLHSTSQGETHAYIISDTNSTEYFDDDIVGRVIGNLSAGWYDFRVTNGPVSDQVNVSHTEYTTSPNSLRLSGTGGTLCLNFSRDAKVSFIHMDVLIPTEPASLQVKLVNETEGTIFRMLAYDLLGAAPVFIENWPGASSVTTSTDGDWANINLSFNWSDYKVNYRVNDVDCGWWNTYNNATSLAYALTLGGGSQNVYVDNLTVSLEDIEFEYEDDTLRNTATYSEINIVNITTVQNHTDEDEVVLIKVPVSDNVRGIATVQNNTAFSNPPLASAVSSLSSVVNNTYYYNPINQFIYIGTFNLSVNHNVNWTITCTYDLVFDLVTPKYLEVGDYFMATGHISNSTLYSIDGFIAETRVLNETFVDMLNTNPTWNCTGGNYQCIFSTYEIPPGRYNVTIELTHSGYLTFKIYKSLYISIEGSGTYSDATVYFNFFNTNYGLGLPKETLKIYANGTRLNSDNLVYHTFTGDNINITVKDYYNSTVYWGNYTVNDTNTFLDLGITFHSWLFGNLNDEYYMVSILKQGASLWWERGCIPFSEREFLIPSGTYCLRIYDENYDEIYNSSLPAGISVVNSRVYVMNGSELQLIINGQSTLLGELKDATIPDIIHYAPNAPMVYSPLKKEGAILGTILVCPALIIIADTVNATNASLPLNRTKDTFYPLVPKATTDNGTITTREDVMSFSGWLNSTVPMWVNVSWLDSTGAMVSYRNYSSIPPPITLHGENISVNCSRGELYVSRTTSYQAETKFYWTKYTDTLFYEATIDVINHFRNETLYNVYVYMEFANDTTPDYNTAQLYNDTGGIYWTRGVNYDTSASGMHWYYRYLPRNETYSFTASYYAVGASPTPKDAVIVVEDYGSSELDGKNYWSLSARWRNDDESSFKGQLKIQFRFNTPKAIDPRTVLIYDEDNSRYLAEKEFALDSYGCTIVQDTMGTVRPNGARNFDIYFNYVDSEDTTHQQIVSEGTNILRGEVSGMPLGHLVSGALAIIGMIFLYIGGIKNIKKNGVAWVCLFLSFLMFLVTNIS